MVGCFVVTGAILDFVSYPFFGSRLRRLARRMRIRVSSGPSASSVTPFGVAHIPVPWLPSVVHGSVVRTMLTLQVFEQLQVHFAAAYSFPISCFSSFGGCGFPVIEGPWRCWSCRDWSDFQWVRVLIPTSIALVRNEGDGWGDNRDLATPETTRELPSSEATRRISLFRGHHLR